ncbi:MAG: hypothetical protein IJJ21_01470 [Firmicutes bacterium]|nr:hypothetical protein [Bacillota bacterium]
MPNTLHVDYELRTHDEAVKIVEEAMEIAGRLRLSLFYDTGLIKADPIDYSLNDFQKK